jgi:hypothetical protein
VFFLVKRRALRDGAHYLPSYSSRLSFALSILDNYHLNVHIERRFRFNKRGFSATLLGGRDRERECSFAEVISNNATVFVHIAGS